MNDDRPTTADRSLARVEKLGKQLAVEKPEQNMRTTVDPDRLRGVILRIVEIAQPDKIVLFGSAARGEMGPNSDVDLLVVKSGVGHRGRLTESIYENLVGVGQAVDVVVVTPEDIERYGDAFCLVIEPALREGKIVYEREAVAAG